MGCYKHLITTSITNRDKITRQVILLFLTAQLFIMNKLGVYVIANTVTISLFYISHTVLQLSRNQYKQQNKHNIQYSFTKVLICNT
jgi:hypothetical protein